MALQYLLELREGKPIAQLMDPYLLNRAGEAGRGLSFDHALSHPSYANGYSDEGVPYEGGRLNFPPLAAGALFSRSTCN